MTSRTVDTQTKRVREKHNQNISGTGTYVAAGIYFGKVIDNKDPDPLKGRVKVHISSLNSPVMPSDSQAVSTNNDSNNNRSNEESKGYYWCRRVLPYGGVTGEESSGNESAYGFLGPAPQKGDEVVVAFTGESVVGVLLGVLPKYLPEGYTTGTTQTGDPAPTYDTTDPVTGASNPSPQLEDLKAQGLDKDSVRGANLSKHTRDSTTRTLNITTPNGHSIIMDDGSEGDQQSNLVRIKSAGGAQFLMDDRNGFIYMITRNGNGWFEINRNGDFNIFSGGSVNIHANGSFNVHANANINMQADLGMNMKSVGEAGIKMEAASGPFDVYANTEMRLSADKNGHIRIAGTLLQSADRIDLNGPKADPAEKPQKVQQLGNNNVTESISEKVPEREPWRGHIDYGEYASGGGGELADPTSTSLGARLINTPDNVSFPSSDDNSFSSGLVSFSNILTEAERKINPELLKKIEKIAIDFGIPLSIVSGKERSDTKKGPGQSFQKARGDAIDIIKKDGSPFSKRELDIISRLASEVGINGIGVSVESIANETANIIHFDLRQSKALFNIFGNDISNNPPPFVKRIFGKYGW